MIKLRNDKYLGRYSIEDSNEGSEQATPSTPADMTRVFSPVSGLQTLLEVVGCLPSLLNVSFRPPGFGFGVE